MARSNGIKLSKHGDFFKKYKSLKGEGVELRRTGALHQILQRCNRNSGEMYSLLKETIPTHMKYTNKRAYGNYSSDYNSVQL